jgi:Fe-S cluster assembly protein SufB
MSESVANSGVHFDPAIDNSKDDINAYLEGTDRSMYDFRNEETDFYKVQSGLTREIIDQISEEKNDPEWMHEFRLKSLDLYNKMQVPNWGPPIDGLNMDDIVTYVRPNTKMQGSWEEVPEEIKSAFDKLGIPKAEHEFLAGVGAQYDSELVYHNLQDFVGKQGVVYSDLESALHNEYADMVREYFMKLVPPTDHKFAALHGAVWSGGSFVYVPKGVHVDMPLQSYFRLNAKGAGQFEHTLIIVDEGADLHFIEGCSAPKWNVANLHAGCVELFIKKGARLRYSTIENWSKNMYNLNTKRALVEEGGRMEWVSGSFGSHVSYLYPTTILKGNDSDVEYTGITFSGKGQNLDTGCRMVHIGENTSSLVTTKSLSKDGGIGTFRSAIEVMPTAKSSKSSVDCQTLMLDDISRSDTVPVMDIKTNNCDIGHEAKIGRISDEAVFYLMSRGIPENEARAMIVSGFANPISKELPLEYAAEMNNLIKLEMEGSMS